MVLSFINDLGGLNLSISGMAHFGLHAQPAPEVSGTSALSKPGGREEVKMLRYHGVVHRVYIYTYIHGIMKYSGILLWYVYIKYVSPRIYTIWSRYLGRSQGPCWLPQK